MNRQEKIEQIKRLAVAYTKLIHGITYEFGTNVFDVRLHGLEQGNGFGFSAEVSSHRHFLTWGHAMPRTHASPDEAVDALLAEAVAVVTKKASELEADAIKLRYVLRREMR